MNLCSLSKNVLSVIFIFIVNFSLYSQDVMINDSSCNIIWNNGLQYYNQNKYSEAIPLFWKTIECDSNLHPTVQNRLYSNAYSRLILCYSTLKMQDSANIVSKLAKDYNIPIDTQIVVEYSDAPIMIGGYNKLKEHLKYPKEARKNGIGGKVILKAIIDEQGNVSNVEVLKEDGNNGFGQAAIEALVKMKFKPAKIKNVPAKCAITVPVSFKP